MRCLFLFIVMQSVLFSAPIDSFAMAKKYIHFVDENYKYAVEGQPYAQPGTEWFYKKDEDFSIRITYPEDHRANWAGKQTLGLIVNVYSSSIWDNFILHKWELVDSEGNQIQMRMPATMLGEKPGLTADYLNKKSDGGVIPFYLNIPKNVEILTLKFDIEIFSKNSQSHRIADEIKLKKAFFTAD